MFTLFRKLHGWQLMWTYFTQTSVENSPKITNLADKKIVIGVFR